jgi:D-alanyl-D-alanine-carboxypeptidase/D-alanyl-D-alanine-endopeptidase
MRRCAGLLLAVWFALAAPVQAQPQSQPLDIGSDPALLARAALGSDPGSASVGVLARRSAAGGHGAAAGRRRRAAGGGRRRPADTAPLYEIGSISKVFTGLLLAQAVERGELALSDTLGQRLQGKVAFASPRWQPSRWSSWSRTGPACHGSSAPCGPGSSRRPVAAGRPCCAVGGAGQPDIGTRRAVPGALQQLWPGGAGRIAGRALRQTLVGAGARTDHRPAGPGRHPAAAGRTAQPRLVPPFDGRRPAVAWEMQAFAGAGGLRSSVQDLVRFGRALVQGRNGPLGAAAERLVTPLAAYRGGQIGYAVFIDGPPERRTWSHDGLTGGYRAQLTIYPDSAEVLVMLAANRQAPLSATQRAAGRVALPGAQHADHRRSAAPGRAGGVYRIDPETVLVCVVHEGTLYVRATRGRCSAPICRWQRIPTSARPVGPSLRFRRDGDRWWVEPGAVRAH